MTVQLLSSAAQVPPHDFEVEQALLGAVLLDNRALDRVGEFLRPEHFADPTHGRIYGASVTLYGRGQIANPVTLKACFAHDGQLAEIGGTAYLAQLMGAAVAVQLAEQYGRQILDMHVRRALIELGERLVSEAYLHDLERPAAALVEEAEGQLGELSADRAEGGKLLRSADFAEDLLAAHDRARREGRRMTGQPTYFQGLDDKLGGLRPGELIVLGGRPSMGKSAKAFAIAANVAEGPEFRGGPGGAVALFLLEGSKEAMAERLLADRADVPYGAIRKAETSQDQFERMAACGRDWLARLPLYVDDSGALSLSAMRARARRLTRRHGLALVVVDHLHLMRSDTALENRTQELSAYTRGFKAMAKELGCPVLLLAQLSRAIEARDDKRPGLSDLRESGSIEQDADAVIFAFREEYYLERAEPMRRANESDDKFNDRYSAWAQRLAEVKGQAEFIIAKRREGETGTVRERWAGAYQRFSDL